MIHRVSLRGSYSFSLFSSAILGDGFDQAVVICTEMDFESAISVAPNTPIVHQQILPKLPDGTPRDPRDLTYMRLRLGSGETRVIAHEWLRGAPTPIDVQTIIATIQVESGSNINVVRDALIAAGIDKFSLTYQKK